MHVKVYEDNDMHIEKWTSANDLSAEFIVAHAEFIFAKQGGKQVADDHLV